MLTRSNGRDRGAKYRVKRVSNTLRTGSLTMTNVTTTDLIPTVPQTSTEMRLEREVCNRCGGTGSYSYCQMHGTRCFKCSGKKEVLTKRGEAAAAYLRTLRSRKLSDLRPGDRIKVNFGGGSVWTTVVQVRPGNVDTDGGVVVDGKIVAFGLVLETEASRFLGVKEDSLYEVALSKEEQLETLRQAIAYQDSLTKAGKPRKR